MKNKIDVFEILRTQKMRLTQRRRAFVLVMLEAHTPISVSDILLRLAKKGSGADKTTVYRELERFQTLGIIQVVDLGDRKKYYEVVSKHHHHLVCVECDQIEAIDIDESKLFREEKKASQEKRFTILRHSLEFFGVCQNCRP